MKLTTVMATLAIAIALPACSGVPKPQAFHSLEAPRDDLKSAKGENWYSERYHMSGDSKMVYDGYEAEYVHNYFPHGGNVFHVSKPVDFYGFLWNEKLQNKMNKIIMQTPPGSDRVFKNRGVSYRFVSTSNLYYSPHNKKPCRSGTLYRENGGRTHAWDKIPSTFCKVGPKGEWLPMT